MREGGEEGEREREKERHRERERVRWIDRNKDLAVTSKTNANPPKQLCLSFSGKT